MTVHVDNIKTRHESALKLQYDEPRTNIARQSERCFRVCEEAPGFRPVPRGLHVAFIFRLRLCGAVEGICPLSEYAQLYGMMPFWDTSLITDMSSAFVDRY
jgi:hypothetical protein